MYAFGKAKNSRAGIVMVGKMSVNSLYSNVEKSVSIKNSTRYLCAGFTATRMNVRKFIERARNLNLYNDGYKKRQ